MDDVFEMKPEHHDQVYKLWEEEFKREDKVRFQELKRGTMENEVKVADEKYVYLENDKVCGFIIAKNWNLSVYIFEVFVEKEKQGKGIGWNLFGKLTKKYSCFKLHVYKEWSAVETYKRWGFEAIWEDSCTGKLLMQWPKKCPIALAAARTKGIF